MRDTTFHNCAKCIHNGQCHDECLDCNFNRKETYSKYSFDKKTGYLENDSIIRQPDTSGSEPATGLPEDIEDTLRKFLYDMFDLQPLELLMLQSIMKQKSLSDFSEDMNKMMRRHSKNGYTRFHAFQLRKSILNKLGDRFSQALLTTGQRKRLKK